MVVIMTVSDKIRDDRGCDIFEPPFKNRPFPNIYLHKPTCEFSSILFIGLFLTPKKSSIFSEIFLRRAGLTYPELVERPRQIKSFN